MVRPMAGLRPGRQFLVGRQTLEAPVQLAGALQIGHIRRCTGSSGSAWTRALPSARAWW